MQVRTHVVRMSTQINAVTIASTGSRGAAIGGEEAEGSSDGQVVTAR